jgi:iron complex outermembrane receptor protein
MGIRTWCYCFIMMALLTTAVHGQHLLTGTITDAEDGSPIIGATVYFPDLKKGTVSDQRGTYTMDQLPMGRMLVEFKFVGYAAEVRTLQIQGRTTFDMALSSRATELHEVIITGISQSTELKSNPVPVITMRSAELQSNTASNLIDNITRKPGISQITTGAAISKPVIRGLGYNRIISLYDGIKQEGQQWGDEHGIEIDEFSVERVEIVKGAGSLMYGSDGLGGVINFLAPDPVPRGTINGKWLSNYQSNGGLFANSISTSGNIKGYYWHIRGSTKYANPYRNRYDERVFNSGFHEADFSGFLGVNRAWGYSQVNVSSFSQSVGLVEGDRNASGDFLYEIDDNGVAVEAVATDEDLTTYSLFIPNQNIRHTRVSTTNSIHAGAARVQLTISYQNNKRKEYGDVLAPDEEALYFDLSTWNYSVGLFLPETHNRQISFGSSGMVQSNLNRGKEFLIPEYRLNDWGLYGFIKQRFNGFDLAGGIRYDIRAIASDPLFLDAEGNPVDAGSGSMKFSAEDLTFQNITGSIGATQRLTKQLTVKLNFSRGFRAPTIAELASNGQHEGSFRYEYGNSQLKPETAHQTDVGFLFHSDHVTTELSLFYNDINNYIYLEKLLARDGTDSIPDPEDPSPAYQYVQGHAVVSGGEFLLDLHPHPFDWLHFENSLSFVNAVNKSGSDSSRYLPFTPPARYQSEIRGNIDRLGTHLANAFLKFEFNHYWKQNKVLLENGTETPTSSYSLWNMGVGADVVTRKQQTLMSVYFTIVNIFDAAYQNHLSRLKYAPENPANQRTGVFNAGRNFSVKVIVPFAVRRPTSD